MYNAFVVIVDVNGTIKCLGNVSVAQNESQCIFYMRLICLICIVALHMK